MDALKSRTILIALTMREDYGLKMDFGQPLGRDFFHFWLVELIRLVVLDLYWHYR